MAALNVKMTELQSVKSKAVMRYCPR
jgi:hypothetical protein